MRLTLPSLALFDVALAVAAWQKARKIARYHIVTALPARCVFPVVFGASATSKLALRASVTSHCQRPKAEQPFGASASLVQGFVAELARIQPIAVDAKTGLVVQSAHDPLRTIRP